MDTSIFTSAKDAALRGETYRERGNYSSAIACFTRALELQPGYAYAHAHRGAAWGALGQIEKARADFDEAVELSPDKSYPWVIGQRAEAERIVARQLMANTQSPQHGEFWYHLHLAELGFEEAVQKMSGSPWLWAHRGATLAHKYVALSNMDEVPMPFLDKVADSAHQSFDEALARNRSYSWAMAFHGYLYALEAKWPECRRWLNEAKMFDTNGTVVALRGVAEVYSFEESFDQSIDLAWEATRESNEDFTAAYFAAIGLSLDGKTPPDVAQAARHHARQLLLDLQSRVQVLLGGLNAIEGRTEEVNALLDQLKGHHSSEALSIIKRDHAWKTWRDNPKYKSLFRLAPVPEKLFDFFMKP